ncbi:MAG: 3-phosphoshikimate 1-carboxyvinyltransferase [Betaproteobacteria bacterium]|nr:3-phosphoshikimate 1-carboxyvinyltransferase [Betaproteobacteria bacterium]
MRPASLVLPAVSRAQGSVVLPGSKSISNRTLLLAALCEGETIVSNLLQSDDTEVMLAALRQLGVRIDEVAANHYQVFGCGGTFPNRQAELFLGNAGTAFRPLTAALALQSGHYTLSGVPRMHERPIGDLVDGLNDLGAQIRYLQNPGFPPLEILPVQTKDISRVKVRGDVSSQFLSALLMTLPLLQRDITVEVVGELISRPYVEITLKLMARFGVVPAQTGWREFHLSPGAYRSPGEIAVEGDASSASYFLAAGAVGGGPVRVQGVGKSSIQGDVRFAETLMAMGAQIAMGDDWIEASGVGGLKAGRLKAIDADLNHIPDAAMTIAMLALFAEGTTTIRNIASWRVKETDRIAAMATELRKFGATVEEGADYIRVTPPYPLPPTPHVTIDTYDDHRMAMCFSLVSLAGVPVTINDPACVAKTFPTYFDEFQKIVS